MICPNCTETIIDGATKCKHCKVILVACQFCLESIPENTEHCSFCDSAQEKAALLHCPFCAESIPENSKICPECDSQISSQQDIPRPAIPVTPINPDNIQNSNGNGTNVHVHQSVNTPIIGFSNGTPTSGLALWSFGLSIGGLLSTWFIPIIAQIISIICGHMALVEIRKSKGTTKGNGYAIAGLIISYGTLVIWFISVLFIASALAALWAAILPKHY